MLSLSLSPNFKISFVDSHFDFTGRVFYHLQNRSEEYLKI